MQRRGSPLTEKKRDGQVNREYERDHKRNDAGLFDAPARLNVCVNLFKEGLQHVQEQDAAQAEPDGWRQGDPPLKIDLVIKICLPRPAAGDRFEDIGGGELQGSRNQHAEQEDQRDPDESFFDWPAFDQRIDEQDECQRPDAVDRAVRAEQDAPVREAPLIDDDFKEHFVAPADDGVQREVQHCRVRCGELRF